MRVAVVAPPWIPVPPDGYGGIEAILVLLADELVARGHAVTLFGAPGSRSRAQVRVTLDRPHPLEMGQAVFEADHVAGALAEIEPVGGSPRYDVIHDHGSFTTVAFADRLRTPVVHTLHGAFSASTAPFYRRHGHKVALVAVSDSQARMAPAEAVPIAVVPNPVAVEQWPFERAKDDYLLWIGRMDPVKGADRAIAVARAAGRPLVLAGPVQPGQEEFFRRAVAPHVDGVNVRYAGVVHGERKAWLYARASALLMPISWPEPFGMVMVEALACGTPVIAFPVGSAAEIVLPGVNGLLVDDEAAMARAVAEVGELDPARCRESVRARYDPALVTAAYEAVYRRAAGLGTRATHSAAPAASRAR